MILFTYLLFSSFFRTFPSTAAAVGNQQPLQSARRETIRQIKRIGFSQGRDEKAPGEFKESLTLPGQGKNILLKS